MIQFLYLYDQLPVLQRDSSDEPDEGEGLDQDDDEGENPPYQP